MVPGGAPKVLLYSIHGCFPKLGVPTIMENQMEKKMENEMETGFISGIIGIRVSQK